MIAQPPIQFDRASGALQGANLWERTAALALAAGSKVSSHFSHRGYNMCANLLRKTLPERDIAIKLNRDATFAFPYGDGYWSKLLNRSYAYEDELELLFRHSVDVDYTLLDCGANYGYWSVLVSSAPYGSHKAIAIEPSSQNFAKLANNAAINGNRFEAMKCAIGAAPGTARLSGTKHEALQHRRRRQRRRRGSAGDHARQSARRRQGLRRWQIPDQARRRGRRDRGHQGRLRGCCRATA